MPHAEVSTRQRARAKALRRVMTRAETLLWRYLKAGHLNELQFRRQTSMGPYILDFVCHSAKLVIELDGESHDFEARVRRDQIRDRWLASRGFTVLRFTNKDVLSTLEGVLTNIREAAQPRVQSATPPSLSLPHKGGGNPKTLTSRERQSERTAGSQP